MTKLRDVCRYVRSKNAGPFWLTIDVFFDSPESYERYRNNPAIGTDAVAALYEVESAKIRRYEVSSLNVVKISIPRSAPQGGVLERDMHGGQQYVPLLEVLLS